MKRINHNIENGSFLVELMIGLLMSSITILGVLTIYAEFEGQKRTTVQMGQTMSNVAIAMFPIEQNAKKAGFGINHLELIGCNVLGYNENRTVKDFNFSLVPVLITPGADNTVSDEITFMSGSSDRSLYPVKLTSSMPNSAAVYKVDTRYGMQEGDLLIAVQSGKDCTLSQISNLPTSSGTSDNVIHNSGNYTNPVTGLQVATTYNKAGGLGISYLKNAKLINIGSEPDITEYKITDNQLAEYNAFNLKSSITSDNIVLMKALYGLDTDNNDTIDNWTNNIGVATNYQYLKAIKIAILARSPLKEKAIGGVCSTTTVSTFSSGGITLDASALPDWNCYRYRLIQSTIPIRNLMWAS
ncbi:hypothetical protein GW796_06140 [archaeon]|nr:hypothetical protein [archaeon]